MKISRQITLLALLWLILVNPGSINISDTSLRMQMAHAWWTGIEEGSPEDKIIINVNNKNYIPYDLGQSMLMLPGDWLGTKLGSIFTNNENERQQFTEAIISFFIFLPLNLLAVITCFRLLRLFGYSEKLAGLSSIVWLLGTSVLFYSSFHQQNNQILLFTLISYQTALAYAIKQEKKLVILSGIASGFAFLIRITSILNAISVFVFLIGCFVYKYKFKLLSKGFKSVVLWMTGFIPLVLLERILTYVRYDSWKATSSSLHLQVYSKADTIVGKSTAVVQGNNNDLSFLNLLEKINLQGILLPLFSPEKSIFLYDPLVLPCLLLSLICWKFLSPYVQWYLGSGILNFCLHLYIYSWNHEWIKLQSWGARYHITSVHLWLIPLIPLLIIGATKQIDKNIKKYSLKVAFSWIAKIIIIVAILIQFASIILPPNLETIQQELGVGSRFRVVQRINNIYNVLNYENKPNIQISKVQQEALGIGRNKKITWNLMPFMLKNELKANSSLNKLIPILFVFWGLICILAITITSWIFIK